MSVHPSITIEQLDLTHTSFICSFCTLILDTYLLNNCPHLVLRLKVNEKLFVCMQKEQIKEVWVRSGCSIVMDGWTDITKRPLINIIVTCVDGPFFLRAIDCSGKRKDAAFQFELLRDAIEEVGPENVV